MPQVEGLLCAIVEAGSTLGAWEEGIPESQGYTLCSASKVQEDMNRSTTESKKLRFVQVGVSNFLLQSSKQLQLVATLRLSTPNACRLSGAGWTPFGKTGTETKVSSMSLAQPRSGAQC